MGPYWNNFSCALHCLFLLHLFHQASSGECELIRSGAILNCSDLSVFPNGSYQDVETLNFHNNNVTELKAFVFKNHSFHNLKLIIIRQNNISHIHPHAFFDMWSVRELVLYGNNLTYLHESAFVGLKGLKHLDLGHNKLVLIEGATLKPLQSLEKLDLSYNNIKVVTPYLLEHTKVSEMHLSGNEIEFTSDEAVIESNSLNILGLQSCKIKKLYIPWFKGSPNLIYLDISYNNLEYLPENLFKSLKYLEQLDISNNQITDLDMGLFYVPSKLDALLCNDNSGQLDEKCSNIVEHLQLVEVPLLNAETNATYSVNNTTSENNAPETPNKENQSARGTIVEFDQLSIATTLFYPKGTTTRPYHKITKPTPKVNKSPLNNGMSEKELEKYLYVVLYCVSGVLVILFVVFIFEIYYLLMLNKKHLPVPTEEV